MTQNAVSTQAAEPQIGEAAIRKKHEKDYDLRKCLGLFSNTQASLPRPLRGRQDERHPMTVIVRGAGGPSPSWGVEFSQGFRGFRV